jgi:4-diphosphocytidyl-2-C-methyl-D-erythritol kinase
MSEVTEQARAKVNLTLNVLGKRPDGYHALDSLVAFADIADTVTLSTSRPVGVSVTGPFSASISGENLISVCLQKLTAAEPRLALGQVTLEKKLPVAAGVGGGSSDAGALLRAVRRANPQFESSLDWAALATSLGADVPVCFANQSQWMSGIGDVLEPLGSPLPVLDAVLVNPRVPVPADKTARVFKALGAGQIAGPGIALARPRIPDRAELLALKTSRV